MARKQSRLTDVVFLPEVEEEKEKVNTTKEKKPVPETKEDNIKMTEKSDKVVKDTKVNKRKPIKPEDRNKFKKVDEVKEIESKKDKEVQTKSSKKRITTKEKVEAFIKDKNLVLVSPEPKEEPFKCICGGKGKYGYELVDDSGDIYTVGKTCLGYCGIILPKKKRRRPTKSKAEDV
jgi:hypothetical protein